MSTLSTHVLDTAVGRPAAGLLVRLERLDGAKWTRLAEKVTDADGRSRQLLEPLTSGVFRLTFDTGDYFRSRNERSFYPEVAIVFEITDPTQHYHVPLLLSPFGYSTYRGS